VASPTRSPHKELLTELNCSDQQAVYIRNGRLEYEASLCARSQRTGLRRALNLALSPVLFLKGRFTGRGRGVAGNRDANDGN
jgi:hypothetical protein